MHLLSPRLISEEPAQNDPLERSVSSPFREMGVLPAQSREKCELALKRLHQVQNSQLGIFPRGVVRDATSYLTARWDPQDPSGEGER